MSKSLTIRNSTAEFLIFTQQAGENGIEVRYEDETIWLTQKLIADLFSIDRSVVTKHLKNIFEDKELDQNSVCAKFAHTAPDGKIYNTLFYNLDAIISVGYRANSRRATQFRQWATSVLKEFAIKGYVLDKKRLENDHTFKIHTNIRKSGNGFLEGSSTSSEPYCFKVERIIDFCLGNSINSKGINIADFVACAIYQILIYNDSDIEWKEKFINSFDKDIQGKIKGYGLKFIPNTAFRNL